MEFDEKSFHDILYGTEHYKREDLCKEPDVLPTVEFSADLEVVNYAVEQWQKNHGFVDVHILFPSHYCHTYINGEQNGCTIVPLSVKLYYTSEEKTRVHVCVSDVCPGKSIERVVCHHQYSRWTRTPINSPCIPVRNS